MRFSKRYVEAYLNNARGFFRMCAPEIHGHYYYLSYQYFFTLKSKAITTDVILHDAAGEQLRCILLFLNLTQRVIYGIFERSLVFGIVYLKLQYNGVETFRFRCWLNLMK